MEIGKIACHALCKKQIISFAEMSNVIKQIQLLDKTLPEELSRL